MIRPPFSVAALLPVFAACHALAAKVESTAAAPRTAVEKEFVAAIQRVHQHLPEAPDSPALEHYVIHDYLVAARLERDLELKPGEELDNTVDAFLQAHANEPVSRGLRVQWLPSLARRHRWDWFLPRAVDVTNPVLLCDRLAGRLATGDTQSLAAEAIALWSLPQKQPTECDAVFAWLRLQGLLNPTLTESRVRAALAADNPRLAREAAAELPAQQAAPLLQWSQLLESPKSALSALAANSSMAVEPAALEAGFTRLARTDAATALSLLPQLLARADMTPALRSSLQRSAALGAAYGRDPGALAAFQALPIEAVDVDVQEWRVRAALWTGEYGVALEWIRQMPPSLSEEPRWRYWRARAVAATAGSEAAQPLYAGITGLRDFYGYLAADRLHRGYTLNARPSTDDRALQKMLAAQPGLVRAHALFDCDMTDEALVEWAVALTDVTPAVKLQAAHLAARWGWYAQAISTLAQVGELDDVRLRYPRPYSGAIARARKLTQLPSDWILAVMRQESLFRNDAISRAGARGLMQMQPATAAAVARRWHLRAPGRQDSPFDPNADVALGAAYLRELLERYGGQLTPSLAAYNAGQVPVARWLPGGPMDADIWIENIPYGETRTYVQRIFEHIVAFAWVRHAEPPRLADLLPRVEPTAFYARTTQPVAQSER